MSKTLNKGNTFRKTGLNKQYYLSNIITNISKEFNNLDEYNINRLFYYDSNYRELLNDNLHLKLKPLVKILVNYLKEGKQ
jgi:hypothetical protein